MGRGADYSHRDEGEGEEDAGEGEEVGKIVFHDYYYSTLGF